MGKRTARSFSELGTVIFLLYFAKLPSASSAPIDQSILGVMQADTDLRCPVPRYLRDSNITQICSNLTYPEESLTSSFEKKNTLLCLAFYDTWYKACDPKQLLMPFTNTSTFYSYIQKFFSEEDEESQTMFCKNVQDVVFSHKKLQPLLSHLHLKNPIVCGQTCFNYKTFNPLCAVLAWSRSIDDKKKRDGVPKVNAATEVDQRPEPKDVGPEPNKGSRQGTAGKDTSKDTKEAKNHPANINPEITKPEPVIETSVPKILQKSPETSASIASPVANSDPAEEHETSNNNSPPASNDQREAPPNVDPANVSDNSRKPSETLHSSTNNVNNGVAETGKDAGDDVRTSTLSENTQDHDASGNQGEWNPMEEDQNDDQAIEAGDQSSSVLGASGRKDTFHSIRPDDESHFITYFTIISMVSIAAYIGYHNKQKILAIVLEGRRARNSRGRRRPSTANYRKLDCTLEEAVTSQCNANVTHVIY